MEDERSEVDALRRGDWRGLEALVRRHQSRAVRIAFAVLGDADLAQDVVAEAFLRVYERRSQFDPERPFAPWFTAIVVNGARKELRKTRRMIPAGSEIRADEWPAAIEDRNDLLVAIRSLPDHERVAIVLRYYIDMSETDMSRLLKWPLGTVKHRLHDAREHLRDVLVGSPAHPATQEKESAPCLEPMSPAKTS